MASPKKNARNQQAEKPAYSASYDLTSLMTQEATSLMVPNGATNPAYIACAVCLVVLLAYCFLFEANAVVAVLGAVVCAALLIIAGRWGDYMGRRITEQGWNALALPEDARRVTVDVWPDRLEVVRPGRPVDTRPLSEVREVKRSDSLAVVVFKDRSLVLIPRKALSHQRFLNCMELIEGRGAPSAS